MFALQSMTEMYRTKKIGGVLIFFVTKEFPNISIFYDNIA